MSVFSQIMPQWDNAGADPGATKKTNGWLVSEKPPAQWFNWLFNRIYNCISEIRDVTDSHLADITNHVPYGGTTTNSGNNYSLAYAGMTSLGAGKAVCFIANADSTGAITLNVNGLGAKSVKKPNGSSLTNVRTGGMYTVRYDGTNFQLQGSDAAGNATPADVVSGKTFSNDTGDQVGTGANARRYASGFVNTNASGYATVSGLAFTPSIVRSGRYYSGSTDNVQVIMANFGLDYNNTSAQFNKLVASAQRYMASFFSNLYQPDTNNMITSDGFKITAASSTTVTWEAWE